MQTDVHTAKLLRNEKELPKSISHIILEIVEYVPNSIARKTIIEKEGSSLSAVSFDKGEIFCEKTTEQDTYIQVIEGNADLTMGKKDIKLKVGESMIIPENTLFCFIANEPFKVTVTVIKNTI